MNKNLFRIIFNKRRGQLMAVAEISSSKGRGTSGETDSSGLPPISGRAAVAISVIGFAVLCALGVVLWALPTPVAHAQVVAYRQAPGNQQPTILQTANGLPQVNIQTPSAAGVSRNVYSQFDVESKGVILNNSHANVQTQQGGWVQANPWLATGSARVILNEVNASNPSQLNGYVEVAGQRAEVVIANPAGISVNGGGFINTSKATLTTGTPIVIGGSLEGYRVQGGNINIQGKGLDLSSTDYAAILARAVQVNAGIWANELKVLTGANQIDASSLAANTTPMATTIAGTGVVPSFALDVAQIGGMYAGKIHLIGTEQGLGVRSAGTIGSTGGDLVLQNNGWLTTTGNLQASENLQITTQGDINSSGTLYARNDQTINANGNITNSGFIAAQGNTSISANSFKSIAKSVVGAGVKADGTSSSNGNLNVATTQLLATNGHNLAAGNMTLTGSSVDLSGSQTGAANITISADSGSVTTANATVATTGTTGVLAVRAKTNSDQTLNNTQGVLSAGQLNLEIANFNNTQGKIIQTGVGNTVIALTSPTSTFNNTSGSLTVNSANVSITASTLTNTDGKIQHAGSGTLTITADSLSNEKGQVASNSHLDMTIATQLNNTDGVLSTGKDLNISAGFGAAQPSGLAELNNTRGVIQSTSGSLNLSIANLDNTKGSVYAHSDLSLVSSGVITNTGFIAAQGNAILSANSLSSSSTGVLAAGIKADGTLANSGDLNITTTQALDAHGQNLAAGKNTLSGSNVNLSGSQTGGANIDITATSGDVNTANATVATPGTLSIVAKTHNNQTLNNTQGVLSAGQFNSDVANLNNSNGQITQTGTGDTTINLTSPTSIFNNTGGKLATNSANLNLITNTLSNTDGKIQHAGADILHITANTLNDQRGKIVSNNALVIDAGVIDQRSASTTAKNITLKSTSLNNNQGEIFQTGNGAMGMSITQGLDNTAGTLASNGKLTVNAQSLTNNQGQVSALGDLTVNLNATQTAGAPQNAGALSNLQGLMAANGHLAITAISVDNTLGTLASVDKNISVTTTGATNNDSGKIQAALDITLTNVGLSNTRTANALATSTSPYGSIIGRNIDINTNTKTLDNSGGTVAANQSANLQTGALSNDGGLIQTGKDLVINTHGQSLTNTHAANYTSSNTALNGKGGIASQGTSTFTTGDLNNDAGYIGSQGALTANTANIHNTLGGQIQGLANLSLTAGNGTTIGTINNTGGLIRSAATATLSAGTVTNSNTLSTAPASSNTNLGIEGKDVSIGTATLSNNSGAIRADNNITITSAGTVNNNVGLMSAGNTLTLQDVQAQNSQPLAITNTDGTLIADKVLTVTASNLAGDGKVLSKGNLNLTLNTDFTNSGQVIANGNATLTTTGNITNNAKLQAGNTLNLTANNINNTVTGEISANTTQVNASNTLTNRGLIDGVETQINAGTVNNIGTGRTYGDHISIKAVNLTNDTETIAGVTKAGTIAARDRLDLGISGTLINREHALIYSVGDMAIGGGLDANRRATGAANSVNNKSATIEAGKDLSLSSATVNNTNDHFAYEIRVASTELDVREDINSELYRMFTRTTYLPYQTASDPAQILAGGDITLNSSKTVNHASHILAGGTLKDDSHSLAHIDVMATKSVHEVGTTYTLVHIPSSGFCGKVSYNCVRAHDEWQPGPYENTVNKTVSVAQVTAANNTMTQIASLQSETVNQTLKTAGITDFHSGEIPQSKVSVQQLDVVPLNSVSGTSTSSSTSAGQATPQTLSVRGAHPNITLPTSSLYKNNPSATSSYLIETDTRFIDRKKWLSSDYLTQSLSLDPTVTQKRLGDGFYEQKLIREQVAELTGRRFLADYTSDDQEYKALMNSAITFGQKHELRPGIALTAHQIAQLTSDIVWLVEQTVTLPDGSIQKVLVPQVYVKVQPGDLDGSGALLSGKNINIHVSGDLTNSGTVVGRNVLKLTADNINNLGGRISGGDVSVTATQDLNNIGASITATNSLKAIAGRDLNIQTTTQSSDTRVGNANFSRTTIDRVAGLYVTGSNGTLIASAGRDTNIIAGVISNDGNGSTSLIASNNLNLKTVQTVEQNNITWDANNHVNYGNTTEVGSMIIAKGNVLLNAKNDLNIKAANVQASGALSAKANNINISAGQNTQNLDVAHQATGRSLLSSTTLTTREIRNSTTALASNLGGRTVEINAGNDIAIKGSNILSDNDLSMTAANNINIEAAQNTSQQSSFRQESKSGLMSSGGLSISYGKQMQSVDGKDTTTTAAASTVGSVGGNINIKAGGQYKQTGSDVLAPGGDITIIAKKTDITEARETNKQSTEQKFEQSGLTLAVTSTVLSTLENAQSQIKATTQTSDSRMKALGTASAAANVKMAADALKAGQGDANGMVKTGNKNADGTPEMAQANAADKAGGIQVALSYGQSSSQSKSTSQSDTARGSSVKAGGTTTIKATGGGKASDLNIQGSGVIGKAVSLEADNKVNLLAAQNTNNQTSNSSNSSASVGIALQLGASGGGVGFTGSLSAGKGSGNGSETTYTNTHLTGADSITIKSGDDTNIRGAVVQAKQVAAKVGGNLNIESLQDTATYAEKNQQVGASGMIGAGMSGSANFAKSNINSNYASVTEQSGIKAGDGGFQVVVKGNVDLKGGAITSTQAAIDNNKNTFTKGGTLTTSDIQNQASYEAKSVSVSVGTGSGGMNIPGQGLSAALTGAGMGKDSGSSSSTTTAGISGIAGDTSKRTGDNAQGIGKIFDADKVRQEITAQATITAEFGKQASKAVNDYSTTQRKELQAQIKTANDADKATLQKQLDEVNTQERVLNILVGAVSGMGASAMTKETLAAAAEEMRTLMVEDSKKFPGVVDSTGKVLSNASGLSVGVNGNGFKLGGTRTDLDLLCGPGNQRCSFETKPDGSIDTSKPVKFTGGKNEDGTPKNQTHDEFLATDAGKEMRGLTGGVQGYKGTLFGKPYEAGSWQDKLIESFAGTHDFIGGKLTGLYDDQGNATRGRDSLTRNAQDAWSATGAVALSTPFAAAQGLPPEVWNAISILLKAAK